MYLLANTQRIKKMDTGSSIGPPETFIKEISKMMKGMVKGK